MNQTRHVSAFATAMAVFFALAGCSHATLQTNNTGSGASPVILTIHDTPPSGMTVTSFEVTVTGAVLQPGNVSLIPTPQIIELTQLQTNSFLLASATQVPAGTYTSLQITFANPEFTFLNNSGVAITVGGHACNPNASCVVSMPTVKQLTNTISTTSTSPFPTVTVTANNQTLLEFDVNLNNLINQQNFSLDFSQSGSVAMTQATNSPGSTSTLGTLKLKGQVASVGSNQFQLNASTSQGLAIKTTSATNFEFGRANCAANNFSCISANQMVDVSVNIQSDGATFDAAEVDFDDASGTQQVGGVIVAENGTPPTSVTMVVHNTNPVLSTVSPGTPMTVTIANSAAFVVNNGSLVIPTGLSFASTADLMVGQEVEARVASGTTISNSSFTTDRLALEPTQLQATATSVNSTVQPPQPSFVLTPLPPIFSQSPVNTVTQIQILTVMQGTATGVTLFQDLTPANLTGLANGQSVTTGGFLFNTTGTVGSPSIVATVVRGVVPGT